MSENPRVGLGVCIIHEGKTLMGKRKNAHGDGSWCYPGGHLEFGETWEECARRETKEETGMDLGKVTFYTATNDIFPEENKHYITIIMLAEYIGGDVCLMEPEKCDGWEWFAQEELPSPLFIPTHNFLTAHPQIFRHTF